MGAVNFLICYDISNTKLRSKIAKYLEAFAIRIQYSVFICDVSKQVINKAKKDILRLINNYADGTIAIYPLCENCYEKLWLIGKPKEERSDFYIF